MSKKLDDINKTLESSHETLEKIDSDFKEKDFIDTPWVPDKIGAYEEEDNNSNRSLRNEEDLDIAIVNDVALTEDDTSLKAVTVRSVFIGVVSA